MKRMQNNKNKQRRLWLDDKPSRKAKANVVYLGDNLPLLKVLATNQMDFIYIDPPFCSQSIYNSKAWGGKTIGFNDKWGGGIHSYMHWLSPRLKEFYRILKDTGVFCLHLDQKSVHYAKVELDKIFGYNNFVNEIIWCYNKWSNTAKYFQKNHDTILIYSKSKNYTFNKQYGPLTASMKQIRDRGYNGGSNNGKKILRVYDKNNQKAIKKINEKNYDNIYYIDEPAPGRSLPDYWNIPFMGGSKKEKLGYPTQKPLALLDRLIKTFTNQNDMVMDAFCGCGTTISSAQKLGRRWLGCDISKDAIEVICSRMKKEHNLKIKIIKTGSLTKDNIMKLEPFQFEQYVVNLIGLPNKKQTKDGGVDGYTHSHIPIQVKKSYKIGRPVLDCFYKHIEKRGAGIIIAHSFSSNLIEEKRRIEQEKGWTIDLIETQDLIRDAS